MRQASSALPLLVRYLPAFLRRRIENRPNLIKILDNIGWLFFDKILRMGVGLIVGVWVARYLGPEQFGLLNFATAFVGLFGGLAGLGLQGIVVRDLVREHSAKEEILGSAAALQFVGGLSSYGLILAIIYWLRPEDALAKTIVAILGSVMLFKSSEVVVYWFESQVLSKFIVWVQNGAFLVFAAIKVFLILENAPLVAFALATVAEALLVAVLTLMIMFGLRSLRIQKIRISMLRIKELMAESWPLLLSGIAVMIYMKIDQIMLGQMIGDEAVGIYSAAVRISEIWYFMPIAIIVSVFPSILESKKGSEKHYYWKFQRLFDIMVWLSISVALPMSFLSAEVVALLFGHTYKDAGSVLSIHIWASVFVFLGVASGKWFIAERRQFLYMQRSIFGAVANIILNLLLIPKFGVHGAAWSTVASYALAAMLSDVMQGSTRRIFLMKLSSFNIFHVYKRSICKKS